MKKTILFGGLLVTLSSAIFVITGNFKQITSGYNIPAAEKGNYVSPHTYSQLLEIDDVNFDGTELTILSKTQRLGMVAMGSVAQVGSGNKYSPVVKVNKFNLTDMTSISESYPINLADLMDKQAPYSIMDAVNLGDVIGTNTDDPRLATIQAKYPKAFQMDAGQASSNSYGINVSYGFGSYNFTYYGATKKIDWVPGGLANYYTKDVITPERVNFGGAEYKIFPWGIDFYNEKRRTITLPIGCNRKDLKNQFYKEIAYVTHNFDGKIINQTIVKFDFTKDHEFIDMVDNLETGEKQLVCILGNKMYMGKQNDPEPNKFTLLVLNPDGSQKLLKNFQHGVKGTEFIPVCAFLNGDMTYVVSRNKLTSTLETFVFDAAGELTIQKSQYADLMAMTYGNKSAAMGFTAGSQKYKPLGLYKLTSGNMLLVADDVHMESAPNPDYVVGSTMSTTISVPRYKNLVAFEYTPAGECKGQYVIDKGYNNTTIPTPIEKVIIKDSRLILMSVDKRMDITNPAVTLRGLVKNNQFVLNGCNEACKPAIFDFDMKAKTAGVSKVSDPTFITLYGTGSYVLLNNEAGVAYYGIKSNALETQVEFQVNVISF